MQLDFGGFPPQKELERGQQMGGVDIPLLRPLRQAFLDDADRPVTDERIELLEIAGSSSKQCMVATFIGSSPMKGGRPLSISNNVAPIA